MDRVNGETDWVECARRTVKRTRTAPKVRELVPRVESPAPTVMELKEPLLHGNKTTATANGRAAEGTHYEPDGGFEACVDRGNVEITETCS
ncbi:MAG: hypothetical protein KGZ25_07175 [Planctomycetes bacterium]|nr:hypothetical protein [Planctomycetota bacterium]